MSATVRQEPMQRKPILMPPDMVKNGASFSAAFLEHLGWAER